MYNKCAVARQYPFQFNKLRIGKSGLSLVESLV